MNGEKTLRDAIAKVKTHAYTPERGPTVVAAFKSGELQTVEECLYVIAELLGGYSPVLTRVREQIKEGQDD